MIEQHTIGAWNGASHAWLQAKRNLSSGGFLEPHAAVVGARRVASNGGEAGLGLLSTRTSAPRASGVDAKAHTAPAGDSSRMPVRAAGQARVRFEALMQAAQDGDGRAYAQLLKEITPLLRNAVRRRRPYFNAADVEDLVQDTLISIHVARATYDPRRPFLPWLFAIVRSRLADSGRRSASRLAHEVPDDGIGETVAADHDSQSETYGDPQLLMRAIRSLPDAQRRVVELLKLQEMSLKEASAVTGMTAGALKASFHRALVALRKKLGAEPGVNRARA